MAIIVFQHSDANRPGRLGLTLRDHAFKLDVRRLDQGDEVPADYDDVDGVISLGGPQNVGDHYNWIPKELAYLRGAHERSLPVVGICLGHQLIAKALGGEVAPMDRPEVGMQGVQLLPAGQTDTVLAGIAWDSPQLLIHEHQVKTLPDGAVALASSKACGVQVFRAGMRTYGFQYHFEADRDMTRAIAHESRETLHKDGLTGPELEEQMDRHYPSFARLADRLCVNIATYLIPRVATMIG